jgi:hypothetical protein
VLEQPTAGGDKLAHAALRIPLGVQRRGDGSAEPAEDAVLRSG